MSRLNIKQEVAEKIAKCGDQVKSIIVDKLVEEKVNERVELIQKGLSKSSVLEKDLKKLLSKTETRNVRKEDGSWSTEKVSIPFTNEEKQNIDKTEKQIKDIDTLIGKMISDNVEPKDIEQLKNLVK